MAKRTCSVDGCDKPHEALGLCVAHYNRQRRHGSLDDRSTTLRGSTVREKLLLNHTVSVEGCWRWEGAHRADGYGVIAADGSTKGVHRVAYEVLVGSIPDGLQIDHVASRGCAHRDCINPAHLEPVTQFENLRRGKSPSTKAAAQTHCIHGHEFTPENTYRNAKGHRWCRACGRERSRRKLERRAAREGRKFIPRKRHPAKEQG